MILRSCNGPHPSPMAMDVTDAITRTVRVRWINPKPARELRNSAPNGHRDSKRQHERRLRPHDVQQLNEIESEHPHEK
jgi:hypothetical protein